MAERRGGNGEVHVLPHSEPRPRVQSAARTVGILLAVAQSDAGLSTKEISERVGIGRQATYHLLHTLVQTGMLTRDDRNRYLLGLRAGTLAEAFTRQLAPAEHLSPLVRELTQQTGETAYASGWWSGEIMTLSSTRGTLPVRAGDVPQGYAGNAHARASGKLLLAYAAPAMREAYLEHSQARASDAQDHHPSGRARRGASRASASRALPRTTRSSRPASAASRSRSTTDTRRSCSRSRLRGTGTSSTSRATSRRCAGSPRCAQTPLGPQRPASAGGQAPSVPPLTPMLSPVM